MRSFTLLLFLVPHFIFSQSKIRELADTVGFAHTAKQMDSIIQRIDAAYGENIAEVKNKKGVSGNEAWKMIVSPHDDYTYAGYMYPLVLQNIKAKTIILFGVAHKAKQLNLQDKIIFDSFSQWKGCYGNIRVSPLRKKIISRLTPE